MTSPSRRSIRFSLRAMLLLVVAVSVCLGWTMHKVLQQTVAVSALLEMDASYGVNYADQKSLTILEHLRYWCGEDKPRNVVRLTIDSRQLTDAALEQLRFGPRSVNDAALAHLQELGQLEELHLRGRQVTDAWLVHLRGLRNLKRLSLDGGEVTDAGLVHLRGLTRLRFLSFMDTQVTATAAEELNASFGLQGVTVCHWPRFAGEDVESSPGCGVCPNDLDEETADDLYLRSVPQTGLEETLNCLPLSWMTTPPTEAIVASEEVSEE